MQNAQEQEASGQEDIQPGLNRGKDPSVDSVGLQFFPGCLALFSKTTKAKQTPYLQEVTQQSLTKEGCEVRKSRN